MLTKYLSKLVPSTLVDYWGFHVFFSKKKRKKERRKEEKKKKRREE